MDYRYRRRSSRGNRRLLIKRMKISAACFVLIGGLLGGGFFLNKKFFRSNNHNTDSTFATLQTSDTAVEDAEPIPTTEETITTTDSAPVEDLLAEAELLAMGYDYDGAINLLQSSAEYHNNPEVLKAITGYDTTKSTLVRANIKEVTHVFFHSLVMDNSKAFDGDVDEPGYNQVMTTSSEFMKILKSMYEKGFVLVRLQDMAYETTDENGKTVMKAGDIMLPEGKKPFVMSQDDVCYYPYMTGDGFATRIIIGENGKPTCEMMMDDGTVAVGSYDLVPILEDFITEHPDFSYKGARAVLAFTGYEGILGYRTTASYADSPTYEQDRKDAAKVAQCLRDNGWELASHSWGHLDLGKVSWERFKTDSDKWEAEVESLIGPTDIILFPFGADVGGWQPYTNANERFNYLQSLGFRYFCNVDSSQYWVQLGNTYLRQGRRNLDGYRLWKDITAEDASKHKLDDLFSAKDVFDPDRPTPVPDM